MTTHLYLAPAAAGKTAYLVARARALSAELGTPRVVVATRLQARSWHRRLAAAGGALGVHVDIFDALYDQILAAAGESYVRFTEPVQYRLLRTLIGAAPLEHYAALRTSPGFVQVMQGLVAELKAGGIFPEDFAKAVRHMGDAGRLRELAALYLAYQQRLQAEGWADRAGIGWLSVEALQRHPEVGADWPCLLVDGFDDLTTVQIDLLRELSGRVGELVLTLTGAVDGATRPEVHRRFKRTRQRLEQALQVAAQPLPLVLPSSLPAAGRAPALVHLESTLLGGPSDRQAAAGAVDLIAAPDREGEVRAALRWLKARIVEDGLRASEVALLARKLDPYRDLVHQIAGEFGMPVYIADGQPLRSNPAVAALLDLLRLALPDEGAFAWRQTIEAWRSPYFDWAGSRIGIVRQDAVALDTLARWASVVEGLDQWQEAFRLLTRPGVAASPDEDLPHMPHTLPVGEEAQALRQKFHRFAERIAPPEGRRPCRVFVRWIEDLIGDAAPAGEERPDDLGIADQVRNGAPALVDRDLAALNVFKDILRGLVWAEEALACEASTYADFYADLVGAVHTAPYRVPLPADREGVLVADVTQARGVALSAVAVLGLAEGEFPAALSEDPFVRDADRRWMREQADLPLDLVAESAEAGYFYEAITRPRRALLLARPRIADNGAPWQASPFWDEVRRRVDVTPQRLTSGSYPDPAAAASWPELMLAVASRPARAGLWSWALTLDPGCAAIQRRAAILARRAGPADEADQYDGDLAAWGAAFARRYGQSHIWSASRLEGYRACPYLFYVGQVLGLEPRLTPAEGFDARQLGNIYHHILERVYQRADDPTNLHDLLHALDQVAEQVLDNAPRREQFQATAWWDQTRQEIQQNLRDTLVALDALRGEYVPHAYEMAFGISGGQGEALVVDDPQTGDRFRLRGFIDRVDRAPDGRVRIVDYKTGGPASYDKRAFEQGKKIQIGLYAVAAQHALGLGQIGDGFYWHVRHAGWHLEHARRARWFTLAKYGPQAAMEQALGYAWEAVRGARRGHFVPHPPDDGCPSYCPAAAFCWRYAPQRW